MGNHPIRRQDQRKKCNITERFICFWTPGTRSHAAARADCVPLAGGTGLLGAAVEHRLVTGTRACSPPWTLKSNLTSNAGSSRWAESVPILQPTSNYIATDLQIIQWLLINSLHNHNLINLVVEKDNQRHAHGVQVMPGRGAGCELRLRSGWVGMLACPLWRDLLLCFSHYCCYRKKNKRAEFCRQE